MRAAGRVGEPVVRTYHSHGRPGSLFDRPRGLGVGAQDRAHGPPRAAVGWSALHPVRIARRPSANWRSTQAPAASWPGRFKQRRRRQLACLLTRWPVPAEAAQQMAEVRH